MDAPLILDALIDNNEIQPCIAVFLDYSFNDRWSEYACNDSFTDFICNHFMVLLKEKHRLPISNHYQDCTVVGSSAGGLAAFYLTLTFPYVFGNAILQSPSFEAMNLNKMKEKIDQSELKNKDVYFNALVGEFENIPIHLQFQGGDIQKILSKDANQLCVDYLKSKQVTVDFNVFCGGHNYVCYRVTLISQLIRLFAYRNRITKNEYVKQQDKIS